MIVKRVYARIGLLGNPSNSYYGKTISVSLANFFAEVGISVMLVQKYLLRSRSGTVYVASEDF